MNSLRVSEVEIPLATSVSFEADRFAWDLATIPDDVFRSGIGRRPPEAR